jgi:hypothetical protein
MSNRSVATSLAAFSPPLSGLLACVLGLISIAPAAGEQVCRPALAFKEVTFSPMQPPMLQRKWTAIVVVDASPCKARSTGYFEIVFERQKENAPDIQFRQEFMWVGFDWVPPVMKVEVDFAADEAVEGHWFDSITPCPCAGGAGSPLAAAQGSR